MTDPRYYSEGEIQEELRDRFRLSRGCRFINQCDYGKRVIDGLPGVDLDCYNRYCSKFVESNDANCCRYQKIREGLARRTGR